MNTLWSSHFTTCNLPAMTQAPLQKKLLYHSKWYRSLKFIIVSLHVSANNFFTSFKKKLVHFLGFFTESTYVGFYVMQYLGWCSMFLVWLREVCVSVSISRKSQSICKIQWLNFGNYCHLKQWTTFQRRWKFLQPTARSYNFYVPKNISLDDCFKTSQQTRVSYKFVTSQLGCTWGTSS